MSVETESAGACAAALTIDETAVVVTNRKREVGIMSYYDYLHLIDEWQMNLVTNGDSFFAWRDSVKSGFILQCDGWGKQPFGEMRCCNTESVLRGTYILCKQ